MCSTFINHNKSFPFIKIFILLFFLLPSSFFISNAQLPICSQKLIYIISLDTNNNVKLYNYNPALPVSASNPILNTINISGSVDLAVGNNLNATTPSTTFYLDSFPGIGLGSSLLCYSNGTKRIPTPNATFQNFGEDYAEGGGYIFAQHYSNPIYIYRYDGSTPPVNVGPYLPFSIADLAADCGGHYYQLVVEPDSQAYPQGLFQYDHNGVLQHSWSIPNNPLSIGQGSHCGGMAIIDNHLYFSLSNNSALYAPDSIVDCTIHGSTLSFNTITAIPLPNVGTFRDMASCATGTLPYLAISSLPAVACAGVPIVFTATTGNAGVNPVLHWYKNNVLVGTNTTYIYATPVVGDSIWCTLTSNDACGSVYNITVKSEVISINEILTPPHPPINRSLINDTLYTITYLAYQWFFKGSPIVNATAINYHFTQNGWYKVQVYDNHGCPGFSDSMHITNVSVSSVYYQNGEVQIFPNPTHSTFQLSTKEPLNIQLYNTLGQMVLGASVNSDASASSATATTTAASTSVTEPAEVNIAQLPIGLYLIREEKTGLIIGKVMKE